VFVIRDVVVVVVVVLLVVIVVAACPGHQVRDLLGEDPLKRLELKEDPSQGVFVKDLVFVEVASVEAIDRVMRDG
jgi:hypothetical protein